MSRPRTSERIRDWRDAKLHEICSTLRSSNVYKELNKEVAFRLETLERESAHWREAYKRLLQERNFLVDTVVETRPILRRLRNFGIRQLIVHEQRDEETAKKIMQQVTSHDS